MIAICKVSRPGISRWALGRAQAPGKAVPWVPAGRTCHLAAGWRWRAARPGRCSSGKDSAAVPCSHRSSGSPWMSGRAQLPAQPSPKSPQQSSLTMTGTCCQPALTLRVHPPPDIVQGEAHPTKSAWWVSGLQAFTQVPFSPHGRADFHSTHGESKAQRDADGVWASSVGPLPKAKHRPHPPVHIQDAVGVTVHHMDE